MAKFELDTAMARYNLAGRKLGDYASSSPLAARRNAEQEYALAVKDLVRNGYAMKLKRKYTD